MDLQHLRLRTRSAAGITAAGDALIDDPFIHSAINDALRDISAIRRLEWLLTFADITISIGDTSIAYPTDAAEIMDLHIRQPDLSYLPVRRGTFADVSGGSLTGQCMWDVVGQFLRISPVPTVGNAARIWYWRSEPELTTDASEPLLPEQYHTIIVDGAVAAVAERRQKFDVAAYHRRQFAEGLERIRKRPGSGGKKGVRQVAYGDGPSEQQYAVWT